MTAPARPTRTAGDGRPWGRRRRRRPPALLVLATVLVASACSRSPGDADPSAEPVPAPTATASTTTAAPATTTTVSPPPPGDDDPLLVTTTAGAVKGTVIGGIRAFLAVPYAADPVGELRFRAPRPHPGWDGVFDATRRGASCPQATGGAVAAFTVMPASDEACLTLDVWSPPDADGAPVMVWFHGGGFTSGSAHQPLYDADLLAAEGVVVVGVNYRLGALGFVALDEAADGDSAVANAGILDQRLALEWVQDEISAFGGDPDRVTIFGESAGGFAVCAHLATDDGPGALFAGAIVQSGGGCDRAADPAGARAAAADWAASLGCDPAAPLACLQALDLDTILASEPPRPEVVADGRLVADDALARTLAGRPPPVPVVTGSNLDEWTLFSIGTTLTDERELAAAVTPLARAAGVDPDALLALYPDGDPKERFDALATDLVFACPAWRFAGALAAADADVYHYEYRYSSPDDPFGLGATHGSELIFLFGHPEGIRGLPTEPSSADAAVGAALRRAWAGFAADGVPDTEPAWPLFDPAGPTTLVVDARTGLTAEIRGGRCPQIADLLP